MKKINELSSRQMREVTGGRMEMEMRVGEPGGGGQRYVCRDDLGGLQMTVPCNSDADCVRYWGPGSRCEAFNS